MVAALPARIQELAEAAFRQFVQDPTHHALRLHALADNDKGNHKKGSFSVSITMKDRAIYVVDGNTNVWYWIGTHNDYDKFVGS
jgi:hypothetical protein